MFSNNTICIELHFENEASLFFRSARRNRPSRKQNVNSPRRVRITPKVAAISNNQPWMWRGRGCTRRTDPKGCESPPSGVRGPVLWPDISSGSYEFLYSMERGERGPVDRRMRDVEKGIKRRMWAVGTNRDRTIERKLAETVWIEKGWLTS